MCQIYVTRPQVHRYRNLEQPYSTSQQSCRHRCKRELSVKVQRKNWAKVILVCTAYTLGIMPENTIAMVYRAKVYQNRGWEAKSAVSRARQTQLCNWASSSHTWGGQVVSLVQRDGIACEFVDGTITRLSSTLKSVVGKLGKLYNVVCLIWQWRKIR